MPIANCIISQNLVAEDLDLISLWADQSGQSPQHMTVNLITSESQLGQPYPVMTNLYLPSLWNSKDIESLQKGLANALAKYFNLKLIEVHVITQILDSGSVVENGEVLKW